MAYKLLDILKEIILEGKGHKYEYGCAMLYFKFPEMFKIQDTINPKDLYEEEDDDTFGLETEPHCTLLFGLHDTVNPDEIKNTLDKFKFSKCVIGNMSLFENDKYDVLKFDVENDILSKVNKALRKYPYTSKFDDYHPHMTIAYVKKGLGKKYVDKFNKYEIEYNLAPQYAVYNPPSGKKSKIKINID